MELRKLLLLPLILFPTSSGSYTKTSWSDLAGWTTDPLFITATTGVSFVTLGHLNATPTPFTKIQAFTGKAVVCGISANKAVDVEVIYDAGSGYVVAGIISADTLKTTKSFSIPPSISEVGIRAVVPSLGLEIYLYEIYVGNLNPLSLQDSASHTRIPIATNCVREEGIYKNLLRLFGTGSNLTLPATIPYPLGDVSYVGNFSTSDVTASLFTQGVGGYSLTKDGATITFTSPFSVTNGEWEWDSTGIDWSIATWVGLAYSPSLLAEPILYLNGTVYPATQIIVPVGTPVAQSASSVVVANDMIGTVQEVRVYSSLLTLQDMTSIIEHTPIRGVPLLSPTGNSITIYINHITGQCVCKPSYNSKGVYKSVPSASTFYSQFIPVIDQRYTLASFTGLSEISELGVYDNDDVMIAYATFPPIIYNATKHHVSFNLLFKRNI